MIIDNLCLDSLLLFLDRLIQIYQDLILSKKNLENSNSGNSTQNYSSFTEESVDDDYECDTRSLSFEEIKTLNNIFINTKNKLIKFKKKGKNYISDKLVQMFKKIDELFKIKDE